MILDNKDLPRASTGAELESQSSTQQQLTGHPPPFKAQLPSKSELEKLIQLYFSSVHRWSEDFGFLTFIHPLHFHRLLADGKAPRELTLIMIANAMRFAGEISSENLAKADAWADTAIEALLPRIYQGFGAIQLMRSQTLLLAQHYDLNRGNFTSAWLLGANCTRMMQMMSLQAFDRTYPATFPPNLHLSPLLSCEALRRLAWSTFFMDSLVDGGRYGFHTVDENSYRLQLPCDQASFLANETVKTEMLFHHQNDPSSSTTNEHIQRGPLDMSAYLIRIAAARRRALHFAFRASHREETVERMTTELETLEEDIGAVVAELPKRFQFNADNMFIHRERLTTFIVLHILRHNLFIILGRAALLIYQRDPYKADLIVQVRQKRISHALPIASIIAEGLKADICFDTHVGIQAYVALEILLFEPRRLANIDSSVNLKSPELMKAIPYLLTVIRDLGHRSESVKQLHIEAVHRLLRCDFTHVMNQTDFNAFHSEYRLVGQDPAEYDFRDFRWAKLERIRRGARTVANNEGRNEALLEYQVDGEVTDQLVAPSPRLDAMDVNSAVNISCSSVSQSSHGLGLSLSTGASGSSNNTAMSAWHSPGPESQGQEFSFDWLWLLEESGQSIYQTGDPVTFWSQLQRI
ncbi:hypothetical protein N7462_002015 [Penicillium macrosclerotiorum]|uniref:uncharacterized protein n=1 Tax=Penicillium macrosclerotiorum TaxID=303699 RepID=UPI00254683B7|nr:uncharacterized protein N7462_002015 [Penicillium macrosclerotiorum]KAJ5692592.1 hypothetical protein N7462_002015 [Penicillium macrosclerotiorum]